MPSADCSCARVRQAARRKHRQLAAVTGTCRPRRRARACSRRSSHWGWQASAGCKRPPKHGRPCLPPILSSIVPFASHTHRSSRLGVRITPTLPCLRTCSSSAPHRSAAAAAHRADCSMLVQLSRQGDLHASTVLVGMPRQPTGRSCCVDYRECDPKPCCRL